MRKPVTLIFVVLLFVTLAYPLNSKSANPETNVAPPFLPNLTVISWNVESGDSNPTVLVQRIKDTNGCDLWGLSEVDAGTMPSQFEAAAEDGEGADFQRILGTTGGADRLMIVYDADRFEKLGQEELSNINVGGSVRAPVVGRFRDRQSGKEFLFVVNHLYRSNNTARHEQARLLNQWAVAQTLPVINVGISISIGNLTTAIPSTMPVMTF